MSKVNNMGTYVLGVGSFPIVAADGVRVLSLTLSAGGNATVTGTARIGSMGLSGAVPLVAGQPTIISNPDIIDGLTIDIAAGSVTVYTNQ